MRYSKYHALGNDYIVINPADLDGELSSLQIQLICHRNYGLGSDGILLGPMKAENADFGLRIFNPDGSEAEKSGNGLRIFSRCLWDQGLVQETPFTVLTPGGKVESRVHPGGRYATVEMGQVSFDSTRIPVNGAPREVLNETIVIQGNPWRFSAATIGNPHCVLLREEVSEEETRTLGPLIEINPLFPNRTNVQFMKVLDRSNIRIEIWERGAGYTLASGSSSSAAAAVARRLGLCESAITVHMPGGKLDIRVSEDFYIQMTGPVTKVSEGTLSQEIFTQSL
ncbi:MAG: diaminopimelate epimerase [Desulfatiglandales bacterium]